MKLPLSLSVAGPSARKHAPALTVAAVLVVLQVGVSLLAPWLLLFAFDPGLLLIGLTVVPVLAAHAVRQRNRIRAVQQDARAESGRLAGATTDLLRSVRAVQAFGRADRANGEFAKLSATLAKAGASATRLREVLDCDEAVIDPPNARTAPALTRDVEFNNVGFSYEPEHPVLDSFDLRITTGETVCLIGPSGIGKSTALHLLLRLYDVDTGQILIDGIDVRHCDQHSVRNRFAYVPQDPWLLDATVAENIAFGNPRSAAAVIDAIRTATTNRTVLVVTHDRDLAAIADRVVTLASPPTRDRPGNHRTTQLQQTEGR